MKKILDVLRMYEADWKLAKFASSEEKTYAVLLPRDSKLSIEQAIKKRRAILIRMDGNGGILVQDLRAVPSHKKLAFWKRLFRWR